MANSFFYKFYSDRLETDEFMVSRIFELDNLYFPTPWTKGAWIDHISKSNYLLGTLNSGDDLIGYLLFEFSIIDSFSHLLKILIIPEFRQSTLAKPFLEKGISLLQERGCGSFFLEVEADNTAAQRLYTSIGFKVIHIKKDFYGSKRNALIMTFIQ